MDIQTLQKANKIQEDIRNIDCTIEYIETFLKKGYKYSDECELRIVPQNSHLYLKISDAPDVIKIIFKHSLEELIKQRKNLEKAFDDL